MMDASQMSDTSLLRSYAFQDGDLTETMEEECRRMRRL